MNKAARSIACGLLTLLIVLILPTALTTAAADIATQHPASSDLSYGWRSGQISPPSQVGTGLEFGLMWESEAVWEFADSEGVQAVVRLNTSRMIPGDVLLEYLIRSCRLDGEVIGLVYGQASYAGSDLTKAVISERYCAIPSVFESLWSDPIRWTSLREVLSTWKFISEARYVFPVEHEQILFGPTGHLGFAVALTEVSDAGATAVVEVDDAEAVPGTEAAPDTEVAPDTEAASAADAASGADAALGSDTTLSEFATPERTARFFLHAVMVDKDPVKGAEAWSPRVAQSAVESVVATEIEFFSDRSSDLLLYVLSSLEYATETTSNQDVIVYVVDGDEKAVLGRFEKHGDEWFIIALGYQLDADLNILPEWKRLAGIE